MSRPVLALKRQSTQSGQRLPVPLVRHPFSGSNLSGVRFCARQAPRDIDRVQPLERRDDPTHERLNREPLREA